MTENPFEKIPNQLDCIPDDAPVVFISYSWDDELHKEWVQRLSNDLRTQYRVYTLLDRYNHGGDDIITFMNKGLKRANRVLIIGTPEYKKKLENAKGGGAKFEDQVISIALYHDMGSDKFIPVLRRGKFEESFNELIEPRFGYDMRNDAEYEIRLQELAADLWGCPMNAAPQLGPKPNFTPAAQILQTQIPTNSRDFATLVKSYILDPGKKILLIELIEGETKKAYTSILQWAHYSTPMNPQLFNEYRNNHLQAIENLMATVVPIVRYGNLEQQKLLIDTMCLLCRKPFSGEITASGSEYVHLLASTFLYHTIGVVCVKYERYDLIREMMLAKVEAPNCLSPSYSFSLENLAGRTRWDYDALNLYLGSSWLYPYSMMIMQSIKATVSNHFFDDNDFSNHYYLWEHLASLCCRYYKCVPLCEDWNPLGGFVNKRISVYRKEDDVYTRFFAAAQTQKEDWPPLKQGLFGSSYEEFEKVFAESEKFYNRNMRR